ncbi:MAG: redoxin domain-containing protein [Myxococcota bacterium]
MKQQKILAGSPFPTIGVDGLAGPTADIGKPNDGADWKMVVVYRGRHCPLCTKYLNKLEAYKGPLREIGIDLEAVSGDSRAQLESHLEKLEVSFPLYYGLSIEQMQQLGLYISYPRSEKETDHPFAEPGLFVVNTEGEVQVVDISNNPFVRPDIEQMYSGLKWIREHNYPIRGTYP